MKNKIAQLSIMFVACLLVAYASWTFASYLQKKAFHQKFDSVIQYYQIKSDILEQEIDRFQNDIDTLEMSSITSTVNQLTLEELKQFLEKSPSKNNTRKIKGICQNQSLNEIEITLIKNNAKIDLLKHQIKMLKNQKLFADDKIKIIRSYESRADSYSILELFEGNENDKLFKKYQ